MYAERDKSRLYAIRVVRFLRGMRNVINHAPTPFGLSVSSVECLSVINHASTIYMNKFNKMLVLTANTADIFQRVIFETKNTCFCHYIKYADNQCDRLF